MDSCRRSSHNLANGGATQSETGPILHQKLLIFAENLYLGSCYSLKSSHETTFWGPKQRQRASHDLKAKSFIDQSWRTAVGGSSLRSHRTSARQAIAPFGAISTQKAILRSWTPFCCPFSMRLHPSLILFLTVKNFTSSIKLSFKLLSQSLFSHFLNFFSCPQHSHLNQFRCLFCQTGASPVRLPHYNTTLLSPF